MIMKDDLFNELYNYLTSKDSVSDVATPDPEPIKFYLI